MKQFKEKSASIKKFAIYTFPFFLFISITLFTLILGLSNHEISIDNFFSNYFQTFSHHIGAELIWVIITIVIYTIVIFCLITFYHHFGYFVRTARTTEHGGAKWIIDEERFNDGITLKKFNEVYPNSYKIPQKAGWVVRAKKNKNQVNYNIRYNTQALCLGATGSGKTQKIIIPGAIYNARLDYDEKPCMVFTDPKGELCEKLGTELEAQGYEILILNLRKPTYSNGWNPLSIAFKYFWDAINFEKRFVKILNAPSKIAFKSITDQTKCFEHHEINCLICIENIQKRNEKFQIYLFKEKEWFADRDKIIHLLKINILELKAAAYEEIENLITVLFPLPKTDNPVWTINAGRMTAGVIYAMLEILEKDRSAFTINQFNLTTVANILANQKKVVAWFQNWASRYPNSKAFMTAAPIINSAEVTRQGIFSNITPALKIFEDLGLQNIVCRNDIDLFKFNEKPKAIFLIIPDEKTNRHILGSLFISQLYTASVFVANENNGTLPRILQFYLDEFGNMPVINDFNSYITVARSRKMFFMLVLQDYKQLYEKYGQEKGATIKNNCNLNLYIQTNDHDTAEAYSKMIGDYTAITRTRNTGAKFEDRLGGNLQQSGIPLIKGADLMRLKDPYGVVLYSKENPAKVYMEYSYKLPNYDFVPYQTITKEKMKIIDYYKDHYFNLLNYGQEKEKEPETPTKPIVGGTVNIQKPTAEAIANTTQEKTRTIQEKNAVTERKKAAIAATQQKKSDNKKQESTTKKQKETNEQTQKAIISSSEQQKNNNR